jgi:hypothetical protein
MDELKLEFQRDTGRHKTDLDNEICQSDISVVEYIEWLEEKLLDDEALFILMNKILNGKSKTQEHLDGPDK